MQLLLLVQQTSMELVVSACESALQAGTTQLPVIINLVHRLAEPVVTDPINITEAPVLDVLPVADVNRYDQLHGQEVTHG